MKLNQIVKTVFVNTSSQIVAKVVTVLLGFFTVGLLTRYLGVEQYGVYTLVFAYLSFFGIFADFGLQLTLVRDVSGDKSSEGLRSAYFFTKIILTIISTLIPLIVLLFFPYSQTIKTAIAVGSIAVAVGYFNAYAASVLQSKMKLDLAALLEVINRVVTVAAIILFVLWHWDIYAIIAAVFIGNMTSFAINMYLTPDYFRITRIPSFNTFMNIMKASFPVGITALLGVLYFKIDTLMLSVMKSTVDVGVYSLSYKLFENIIMLWLFYIASVYPLLSRSVKVNDDKNLWKIIKNSLLVALILSAGAMIISFIAAPLAVTILGGKDFVASVLPFRILIFALPFVFMNNLFYYVLLSFAKVRAIVSILLLSLALNFVLNLFVIPLYGYIGISVSTVITEAIVLVSYLFVVKRSNLLRRYSV